MAEGLNQVVLLGALGADSELRFTQSNQAVLNFRMATTESYFDNNSKERKETTEWHSVVLWGKVAESLSKILVKGKSVSVVGSLQTRSWEKDGQKHYKTEIKAKKVILLGGGKGRQDSDSNGSQAHDAVSDGDMSDIPF